MTSKVTLFINQLPYSATREDVAAHFAQAAGTTAAALLPSCRLVLKDGAFKGTAFVDVTDFESCDRGLALHQSQFKASSDGSSRRINVREAVSKTRLEQIAERSKFSRNQVLRKAYTGKTKAGPLPARPNASDNESEEGSVDEDEGEEDEDEEGESGDARAMQGPLGKDRKGKEVVGEVDPQRKRKVIEEAYLKQRRELMDMAVTCHECAKPFTFTVIEQEFFLERGWKIPRTRCKACSDAKKAKHAAKGGKGGKGGGGAAAQFSRLPLVTHPYGARVLKRLVQAVPGFAAALLPHLSGSLREWACKGGGWVVLALLEAEACKARVGEELRGAAAAAIAESDAPGCRALATALGATPPANAPSPAAAGGKASKAPKAGKEAKSRGVAKGAPKGSKGGTPKGTPKAKSKK